MNKFFTLVGIVSISFSSMMAQDAAPKKDTTYWKKAGFIGLNGSQTWLSDWAGGGQNNTAINSIFNYQIDYNKDKISWTTKLDAQYGLVRTGASNILKKTTVNPFRKNIDQIFALSKFNVNAFSKYWFYAAQVDYRSQFAPGYEYDGNTIKGRAKSDFNSPGYTQIAIGLDYKPAPYFSAFLAPVAGKITTVNRQYLADEGAYGVEKAVLDANGNIITPGKRSRYEFGGRLVFKFKKDIMKNVNLDSYLDLFSNYLNNSGNIDVVFNNLITFKVNKYITANLISQMNYDNDIIRKRDLNANGSIEPSLGDINGPRLQLLTTFALGFGYKF